MNVDEKYMLRCLELADCGRGHVSPNPMVGAVVVCDGKIIGEGYHREYGKAHAEVNAIASVADEEQLKRSTIYVSLEPCSHYGKTPPCAELIIKKQIPKVVVASLDPFPAVSGNGVKMLRDAGIDVTVGLLEKEAIWLNKEFITAQTKQRPYIYLKWAESSDGFIDITRNNPSTPPTVLSDARNARRVHKLRSEVAAIMVGSNTAYLDNPSLTVRHWHGKNPIRIVLDREGKLPNNLNLFDNSVKTIVFTEQDKEDSTNIEYVKIEFNDELLPNILTELNRRKVSSLLVEGGAKLLDSFINADLWDEAIIETSSVKLYKGIKSPTLEGVLTENTSETDRILRKYLNKSAFDFFFISSES